MRSGIYQLKWGGFSLIEGDMISQFAKKYGEWSEVEVHFFHTLLRHNDNVIEIGSNLGMHAVPLAKAIPNGKLFCFEPQRVIFQRLCCNLALNNLTNAYCYNMGLGEFSGMIEIQATDYDTPWNYGSFSLMRGFSTEGNFQGKVSSELISVQKLDEHQEIQRLASIRLIKIDVEGLELSVLKGAENTINQHKPIIFIEAHLHSSDDILARMHELGYECYWFISRRCQPENYFKCHDNNDESYDINFVCYPLSLLEQVPSCLTKATFLRQIPDNQPDSVSLPLIDHQTLFLATAAKHDN